MTKRLIRHNPLTGMSVWWEYQPSQDSVTITHDQPEEHVQLILDANKEAANDRDKSRRGIKNDWWHYAKIPNIVWLQWMNETGRDMYARENKKELFDRVNSRDFRDLKVTDLVHNERE